jgi:predicted type IV restriction endonuclease
MLRNGEGRMAELRDVIEQYVKRVKEMAEIVKGNEQATKQSLIGPFFTMLGYDLTDPRECVPEYKVDFGKGRSTKPIDWAFRNNGAFTFFVEAKEVGGKIAGYDEQLADYFAKDQNVKLGILTNGAHWRFFTDVVNANVMDKEPFAKWDVFKEAPPFDVIKLIAKSGFNAENIHTYAKRRHEQNLLVGELTRLLEPAPAFTKLAIEKIETRNLTQAVVETWAPIVAGALTEWARQRMLTAALAAPMVTDSTPDANEKSEPTQEELDAFAVMKKILGRDRGIAYEDSVAYFKIRLAEKRTWVFCRLQLGRRHPAVWVPLPLDRATELAGGRAVVMNNGWAVISLNEATEIADLRELIEAAYAHVKHERTATDE